MGAPNQPDGHDRRVARLAVHIGQELGMGPAELGVLSRSGLLHDVGKLGIPQAILEKSGALTDSEWRVMKTHPELGLTILGAGARAGRTFNWTGSFSREMLAVLYHHERMDGSGYPHGLAAWEIPIEARIVAVADTFDVLTSDRPYRLAFTPIEAVRRLQDEAGPHLDPRVVEALLRTVALRPPYRYVA